MPAPTLLFTDDGPAAPARPARPLWQSLALVVAVFLLTRLMTWTAAYSGALVNVRIAHQLEPPFDVALAKFKDVPPEANPVAYTTQLRLFDFAPLVRFDGSHYRSIIEGGYSYRPVLADATAGERQQNIAFFPLYPLLCMPFTAVMSTSAAQVLVANGATLAALLIFFTWIRQRIGDAAATFACACVLCWPTSCYYTFGYAESTTLALTAATLALADRQRWAAAAVCCGLATATRPTAAGLAAVLLLAYLLRSGLPWRATLLRATPLAVTAAAGALAYAAYLTVRFGSPQVYFTNFRIGWVPDAHRADWLQYLTLARVWDQFKYLGRAVRGFPVSLPELWNSFTWNMPLNMAILFLSLAGLARAPRNFRPFLLLGPLIFLQSYAASGGATFGVEPIARYTAVALPAFVVLAAWAVREWSAGARATLLAALCVVQSAWAFRFALGEWSS